MLPWIVAVAFFMESLDTTILNTAIFAISAALHVVPLSMKAVVASYTLSLAVFIPISGWMADRFGTRRVFASAIGLFTLGSLLCGISSDIHLLVACRVLQGCGGAMMVTVGRLILVRSFDKSELLRTMSFVAIPASVFCTTELERVALSVGCRGKGYWCKRVDRAPRLSSFTYQKRESG
jgi:MFS family permease